MRFSRQLFASFLMMTAMLLAAVTSNANADTGYTVLSPPMPTESGKKIEVTEFFAYYCPHCSSFDPSLTEWVKKQGDNIVFKRVHVTANGEPMAQQRLFYTLDAMGKLEEWHQKIFQAIHTQRAHLDTDEDVIDFMTRAGMDKTKFLETYNSFGVRSRVQQAIRTQISFKIDSWPTVVIDGRYRTAPSMAGPTVGSKSEAQSQAAALKLMDDLVLKAAKDKAEH